MTAERSPETLLPLSAVAFEILLTLADGDSHGYHIMQEVERRTSGAITLHPGTLYRALARLLEQDVIDELDGSGAPRAVKKDDGRRRSYRLTRFGRAVLAAEAARLEQQVREARARRLLNRQER
jgi:DNA-binding PadR family transcriptional regulator